MNGISVCSCPVVVFDVGGFEPSGSAAGLS